MARQTTWMGTGGMSLDPVPDLLIRTHTHTHTLGSVRITGIAKY